MGRLRLDLELAYNSVAGCSTDDSVDAHGSEHGTIPSSPIEVEEKMTGWLSKFSTAPEGGAASGGHHGRYLGSAEDFVTSGFRTPEEVLSQIWSIVSQLQSKAAPALAKERSSPAGTEAAGQAKEGGGVEVGGEGEGEREEEQREPLASTLLVAPRLHPFNAAEFENFGLNLAIALKQTPIMDRIEIEIYHPEFVCDGGIVDPLRRSPFPTLLVKHCGLKDELFEPSGMYRHAVPPLKLPLEASPPTAEGDVGVDGSADGDTDPSSSSPETSTDTSADGAQL